MNYSMFNKIINNALFISGTAVTSGIIYKCFKDLYDDTTRLNNHYVSHSNSIFNSGMFVGTLLGFTYSYLKCPGLLHETLKLEN